MILAGVREAKILMFARFQTCVGRVGKIAAFLLVCALGLPGQQLNGKGDASTNGAYWKQIHRTADLDFASSTKLPLTEVQGLRRAAGVEDSMPGVEIERMWPIHSTDRYLVTTVAGEAECMKLGVYEKTKGGFRRVWSADRLPNGEALCGGIVCPRPWVMMTKDAGIRTEASSRGKNVTNEACSLVIHLTYSPKGPGYELSENRTETRKCDFWTYHQSLGEAFGATSENRNRILTVEIVPSFLNEWAIVFDKSPNGITVSKISFDKHLWTTLALGAPGPGKTAEGCLWIAKHSPTTREAVLIEREKVSKFLADFERVDLHMDRCSRNASGNCVYMADGTAYYVVLPNRQARRVSGWGGASDTKNENPQLAEWVREVIRTADTRR
jgi:hypothetical protein